MKEFDDHELLTNEDDQQWYRENMELSGLEYNKYLWIKMEPAYYPVENKLVFFSTIFGICFATIAAIVAIVVLIVN